MRFLPHAAVGLVAGCALLSPSPASAQTLSIPNSGLSSDVAATRSSAITAFQSRIVNEQRELIISGKPYPLYHGPVAREGSLTQQIQAQEVAKFSLYRPNATTVLPELLMSMLPNISKFEDYAAFYEAGKDYMELPTAMDNCDETFGTQRVSLKGFNLKLVRSTHHGHYEPEDPSLTDENVAKICGSDVTLANVRELKQLFVADYSDYAQFNDPEAPNKYVAPIIGFFCYNKDTQKLMPLAIRVISLDDNDVSLTYTSYDTKDEWTLAKMALESMDIAYQQTQHMAETHAITIPIRVELFRHMSAQHPISALLLRHSAADFGLELKASEDLLNASTILDQTFGYGATGATRFIDYQLRNKFSMKNDFVHDMRARGLHHIPNHKFGLYAEMHYNAISDFVEDYLHAYYASEDEICADFELQNWAQACAQVPHLHDFPAKIDSFKTLHKLLTQLVFQCAVKHHAMNGGPSWDATAVPYSTPALWKAMPTAKLQPGESLDLMEYTIPKTLAPKLIALASNFNRAPPVSESLLSAYKAEPFASETVLADAIAEFESNLEDIDAFIVDREKDEKWPYHLLRPGRLPYYTWI